MWHGQSQELLMAESSSRGPWELSGDEGSLIAWWEKRWHCRGQWSHFHTNRDGEKWGVTMPVSALGYCNATSCFSQWVQFVAIINDVIFTKLAFDYIKVTNILKYGGYLLRLRALLRSPHKNAIPIISPIGKSGYATGSLFVSCILKHLLHKYLLNTGKPSIINLQV